MCATHGEDRLDISPLCLWLAPLCMDSDVVIALWLLHLSGVGELEQSQNTCRERGREGGREGSSYYIYIVHLVLQLYTRSIMVYTPSDVISVVLLHNINDN